MRKRFVGAGPAGIVLAGMVALWLVSAAARAQQPSGTAPAKPTPEAAGPSDEFDRGTPRGAVGGYLKACRDGDYERAAEYLDLSRVKAQDRSREGPVLARHLKVVVDHALWVDLDALSDAPEGNLNDALPPRRERVGTVRTAKDAVDILLERGPRDDGVPIWKFSSMTVAKIPALYAEFGYGPLADWLPEPLFEITFLNVELWQWIGMAVLIVCAVLFSWLLTALIARMIRPLVTRLHNGFEDRIEQLIIGPVRLGIGITLLYWGTLMLGLSLPVQAFFNDLAKAVVLAALTWLAMRLIDIATLRIEDRFVARGQAAAVAILPLTRRVVKVFLIAIGAVAFLQNLGFNIGGLLAGLGVGGLAVALAAQETVKNFFGGVALITDQPVRVGDLCRFGDKMGKVEDISLWSTRVRTLDRTVVSVPNAQFASMQLENLTRRDRIRLYTTVGLHYDTTPDQLRRVLSEIKKMLHDHPKIHGDSAYALFGGFGPSLHIEIFAYVLTSQFEEYVGVREEVFLRMMDIVSAAGSKFAAP